ncbi:DUF523 domain-containing protein [Candidatus Woesearchaeota archaeon]|nr:DUF523 domain-containing protein [Candidatus Woesearchaeota archaeon]
MDKEPVIISMCSLGIPCQYRARSFRRKIVDNYMDKYFLIPVCPEQLGGLSTPRVACHLEGNKIIGKEGKDYTSFYQRGAELALKIARGYSVKKAYLKRGSPSCGVDGVTKKLFEKEGIKVYLI